MTTTDLPAWIAFAPWALLAGLAVLGLTALIEGTERGRAICDRLIERIVP